MNQPFNLGRRSFLLGLGGASLALPLLPSLVGETRAQEIPTKNFISYRITNGMFGQHWYPTDEAAAGLSMTEPNVREMRLSDIAGPISTLLDERFDRFRDKMVLTRHIDRLDLADHQPHNGLFGWSVNDDDPPDLFVGKPASIDQLMAQHVFQGTVVPLNLSVRWSETGRSCSVSVDPSGNLSVAPGLYPQQAFEQLFADFGLEADVAARRRAYRRSIVDRVLPHYQQVRGNSRLSRSDRETLDQHIEHMHTLQAQLARNIGECTAPDRPDDFRRSPDAVDAAAQAQVDIAVAALRCGLTRIVNLYLDPDVLFDPDLHGVAGGHHGASHGSDDAAVRSVENAHHWHMRYLSDFIGKLEDTATVEGTLLDESLVFVNNEIGNQAGRSGNAPGDYDTNHIGLDVQCMFIGSCGGAIQTGKFIDYRTEHERSRWTRYIGTCYNRALITCMLAMGMTPDQWEVGGEPGYGDMRGARYNQTPLDEVVIGDLRAMLPGLAPS